MGIRSSRLFIYTISLTFNEADRFITATPLYFGGARYMTMAYLFMGATVVLFPPPYSRKSLARAVNDQRITALFLVPTLLRRLLEMPKSSLPLMPGVRLLISSGSSLYPEERRRDHARAVSELLQFLQLVRRRRHFAAAARASGRGLALGRARSCSAPKSQIIDEQHRPVPAGTVGAIRYRGGASPTAIIATRKRARPRSATAGTIRAISAASTPTAFSISPAAPRT